ncbi:MAG: hypothetical protein Q8936_03935 [Bacillota bacterium]|nr:hypothetical protein [Bacillota bacterium]
MYVYYLINLILGLVVFYHQKRHKKDHALIGLLIMVFLPYVGMIIYIILELSSRYIHEFERDKFQYNVDEDNQHISLLLRKEALKEGIDIIPIEDALVLNDEGVKRNLIINALKGDAYQYLGFLKKALKDEDTETSHYAATAVTEVKRKLTLAMQELEEKCQEDNSNIDIFKTYADIIKRYMDSGLLDKKTQKEYLYKYRRVLKYILKYDKTEEYYFEQIVKCNIITKNYDKAIYYSYKYMKYFSKSYKPYLLLMNIYYTARNKEEFSQVLDELRNSHIRLEKDALEIVRFWIEGECLVREIKS